MARELGHDLRPIEEVRDLILSLVEPLGVEDCALAEAHGRILGEDLVAREPVPPFDNSAMDGYAVRARDLSAASEEHPVKLPLSGEVAAGGSASERLAPGTVIRIMTGAPVPEGSDAVVPHELTRRGGEEIEFFGPIEPRKNIRAAGGDMQPGDRPLEAGGRLRAAQVALAASLGRARLEVSRRPLVAVLSPGDELVGVGETPGPGKIRNSNAYSIASLLRDAGAVPLDLGIVPDDEDAIDGAIREALVSGADAIVSTGGVSAGDYDYVRTVVARRGRPAHVLKVAMRPGKPQVFGLLDGRPFFGLPGNPASSIISFEVFVRPALRKMLGERRVLPPMFGVRFPFEYRYKSGRTFLLRAGVEPGPEPDRDLCVVPPGSQDSSFLASLARANAVVVLPADEDRVAPGERRLAFWMTGSEPW